jgi:hypothetical protein
LGSVFPAAAGQDVPSKDATSEGFHYPSTSAEQFLDLILTLEGGIGDAALGWYAENVPWRDTRKDAHYARLITPGLREAISREEARQVKENCDGKYIEGDNCSFDTNTIICAQDFPEEGVLFRTEKTGRDMAIITYRWPHGTRVLGTYRLVRAGGVWKLDGIRCHDPTMSFNMP